MLRIGSAFAILGAIVITLGNTGSFAEDSVPVWYCQTDEGQEGGIDPLELNPNGVVIYISFPDTEYPYDVHPHHTLPPWWDTVRTEVEAFLTTMSYGKHNLTLQAIQRPGSDSIYVADSSWKYYSRYEENHHFSSLNPEITEKIEADWGGGFLDTFDVRFWCYEANITWPFADGENCYFIYSWTDSIWTWSGPGVQKWCFGHEYGHCLGLGHPKHNNRRRHYGIYSLMENVADRNRIGERGCLPFCPEFLMDLGWLDASRIVDVTQNQYDVHIEDVRDSILGRLYRIPISDNEYFYAVNHQQTWPGDHYYDAKGLLIWHIIRKSQHPEHTEMDIEAPHGSYSNTNFYYPKIGTLTVDDVVRGRWEFDSLDLATPSPTESLACDSLDFISRIFAWAQYQRGYALDSLPSYSSGPRDFWNQSTGTDFAVCTNPNTNGYSGTSPSRYSPQTVLTNVAVLNVRESGSTIIADLLVDAPPLSSLSDATSSNNQRKSTLSSSDNPHLVWHSTDGGLESYCYHNSKSLFGDWIGLNCLGEGKFPTVAVDDADVINVCWIQEEDTISRLYYCKKDGIWQSPEILLQSESVDGVGFSPPAITVDADGIVHIVLTKIFCAMEEQGEPPAPPGAVTHWTLIYEHYDPLSGASEVDAVDAVNVDGFVGLANSVASIDIEADGTLHIAWTRPDWAPDGEKLHYVSGTLGNWSSSTQVGHGEHPFIESADGLIHVAYESNGDVWYQSWSDTIETDPVNMSSSLDNSESPQILGGLVFAWSEERPQDPPGGGDQYETYYKIYRDREWQGPHNLSNTGLADSRCPQVDFTTIASSGFGNLLCSWTEGDETPYELEVITDTIDVSPKAPTGLWFEYLSVGSPCGGLAWDANTEADLAGYSIYRRAEGEDWQWRGSSSANYYEDCWTYNKTYYFYVTAVDLAGYESDSSDLVSIYTPPSGCPFLYAWDGQTFLEDNALFAGTETDSTENAVDVYKLEVPLVADDSSYSLEIREWELAESYLDRIRLLAADHPESTDVVVTTDGEIRLYQEMLDLVSCRDGQENDIMPLVQDIGGGFFSGSAGDEVIASFGMQDSGQIYCLIDRPRIKRTPMLAYIDDGGQWDLLDLLYPRAKWSTQGVTFSLAQATDVKIRLLLKGDHDIDYIALAKLDSSPPNTTTCALISAYHSTLRSGVEESIQYLDSVYANVTTGDSLRLVFDQTTTPPEGIRDFILVSEGYSRKGPLDAEHPSKLYTGHMPVDLTITIYDGYSEPIESVFVLLDQPSCSLDLDGYTDAEGKVTFPEFTACWEEGGDSVLVSASKIGYFGYEEYIAIRRGCPYLFVWDGKSFEEDNNIIPPDTRDSVETDGVDYYKLERPLVAKKSPQGNYYQLQIREYDQEHSYLDQTKLYALDHPYDTDAGVTSEGSVLVWDTLMIPQFCEDDSGKDCLPYLKHMGDDCFDGQAGDTLLLKFSGYDPPLYLVNFVSQKSHPASIIVDILGESSWVCIDTIHPRMNWCPSFTDLSTFVDSSADSITVRLAFSANHKLDHVALIQPLDTTTGMWTCSLLEATHSSQGSVKTELMSADGNRAELMGSESIELYFALPDSLMFGERDFVFVTTGYYVEEGYGQQSGGELAFILPRVFQLHPGYPNPFTSAVTIRYALPRKARVKVVVYDAAGRLVSTLTDQTCEPGYYRTSWKGDDFRGRHLPSGTYFIRMESEDFTSTRKVVLMR